MSKQFKVGLIALVSGAVLYWGFNFLKGTNFFSPTNKYYVIYEAVDGLNESNDVTINGWVVGRVSKIDLIQNGENSLIVELDIKEGIKLGKGAKAALASSDIFGSKKIILTVGDVNNPIMPGDTLEAVVENMFDEIIASASPAVAGINTTIAGINEILRDMKGSGKDLKVTMEQIKEMSEKVNGMMDANRANLREITESTSLLIPNIDAKVDQLGNLMTKSEGIMDSISNIQINQTLAGIDTVLYNLNETLLYLKESEGTLGKMVNDDSVYNNLNKLLMDIDRLVIHFDNYPKDFLRPLGRKHKKLKRPAENGEQ